MIDKIKNYIRKRIIAFIYDDNIGSNEIALELYKLQSDRKK